jgi:cytochrome oxidase Cu insertion factor (SCO1/SenC/PrrC family)
MTRLLRGLASGLAGTALVLLVLGALTGAMDDPQNALVNDALPFYRSVDMRPRWDRWSSWQHTSNFALIDQRNRGFDQGLLERHATVVGFFFAGCSSVCPVSVEVLREFDAQLGKVPGSGRPQVLLLTLTPEFDTPDVLARYAERMQLPPEWILATGPSRDIDRLAASLLSDVRTTAPGVEPAHASRVFLLDPRRRIRGVYDGGSLIEMRRMAGDYRRLERELATPERH